MTAHRRRVRYPAVAVTCSPIGWSDREIPDPVLVVEVLADCTAGADRGVRCAEYAGLASVRRYVILAAHEPLALVHAREDGFTERRVRDALPIPEWGLSLPFADLYDGLIPISLPASP